MTLRSLQVPSVLGGVTQQPASLARPDRVKVARNVFPFPDRGLAKRPGSSWLNTIVENDDLAVALTGLDLGAGDRFVLAASHDHLRAYRPSGEEVPIFSTGSTPDFTYLDLRTENLLTAPENFADAAWLVDDFAFSTGGQAVAAVNVANPKSPLGWDPRSSDGSITQSRYSRLVKVASGSPVTASYAQLLTNGIYGSFVKFSVYVNTLGVTLPEAVALFLIDDYNGATFTNQFFARFEWLSGSTSPPTVTFEGDGTLTTLAAVKGYVEQVGTNDFRLMVVLDTTLSGALVGTQDGAAGIALLDSVGVGERRIWTWGAHLQNASDDKRSFPKYAEDPHLLRPLSIVDTTFVSNPMVTAAQGTSASATRAATLGTWAFFPGDLGAKQVGNVGFIWVRQAVATTYKFEIVVKPVAGAEVRIIGEFVTEQVSTALIGREYAVAINTAIAAIGTTDDHVHAVTIGSTATTSAADNRSSVVVIRVRDTYELLSIRSEDPVGGGASVAFIDEIETVSDLPLLGIDGVVVKLVGIDELADSSVDAYSRAVLRFRETQELIVSSANLGSAGFWEEGTDYGTIVDLDEDTLPHTLTRRQDVAAGTVTGEPFGIYFDFDPFTWDNRLVGSDERNPPPSFVGKKIGGIGLFQNRLVLTADMNLLMSEANVFGNFWRTTLRTLPDSERIDITVSGVKETVLRHVAQTQETMFLFSENAALMLEYGDFLSPRSVSVAPVSSFGSGIYAKPSAAGELLIYAVPNNRDWARVEGLLHQNENTANLPLSAEVPRFIPNDVLSVVTHDGTGLTFFLTTDTATVFCLRNLQSGGDLIQNAWTEMRVGDASVCSLGLLRDELFIATRRGGETHLESIPLASVITDQDEDFHAALDGRVDETQCTEVFSSPNTTITLPYAPTTPADMRVIARLPLSVDGLDYSIVSATGSTVVVTGNLTADTFYVGAFSRTRIEPLVPSVFESGRTFEGRAPRPSAVEVVRRLSLELTETGHADLEVTYGGSTTTDTHDQDDPLDPHRAELATVIGSDPSDVEIVLQDTSHFPFALTAMEWEVDVETDS